MSHHTIDHFVSRNLGLDLVRVTETAALAAGRWVGSGNYMAAHRSATMAMEAALNTLDIDGRIVIGENERDSQIKLCSGQTVGSGEGPTVDLVVDPIDGTELLIKGHHGAISLVGMAPRDTMWDPGPALYMEKIVVDREAAKVLVPECLDAPAAWTLALIARAKSKAVRDLTILILDRPRHIDLIDEIRATGARVLLRDDGDAEGALLATSIEIAPDILMGIGGVSQGIIAACAVQAMNGGMLARLAPQSDEERAEILAAGIDIQQILTCTELVKSDEVIFTATGVTDTRLLPPVRYKNNFAETHSLLMRGATGTRRFIHAEHAARV